MEAKLTVIIPIYNTEKRLRKCIDSVINQSFKDIEIILVDDGSKDGSPAICDEYASKYENIEVIHQVNQGVSAARNAGIERSTTKYICFIDSDDEAKSLLYEKLYSNAEENNADCVICYYQLGSGAVRKHVFGETLIKGNKEVFDKLLVPMITPYHKDRPLLNSPVNKIYKREVIDKNNIRFDKDLSYAEDWIFNMTYFKYAESVKFITDALYIYNDSQGSLSNRYDPKEFEHVVKMKRIMKSLFPDYITDEWVCSEICQTSIRANQNYLFKLGLKGYKQYTYSMFENKELQDAYSGLPKTSNIKYKNIFASGNAKAYYHKILKDNKSTVVKYYAKKLKKKLAK